MGLSKTEVNFRRLLAAAPQQQNKAKLLHYVATLREQLEQLAEERTLEGLPRFSKAVLNDYSEKIEAIAANIASPAIEMQKSLEPVATTPSSEGRPKIEVEDVHSPSGLRRRFALNSPSSSVESRMHDTVEPNLSASVKLDTAAQAHLSKHRKLQEDLTDDMVVLAQQLKESSKMISQSLKNTEKILDSTENAVEHSLASTGHVNAQAVTIYSESFRTSCFTWIVIFSMTCVFVTVVLLIRVT